MRVFFFYILLFFSFTSSANDLFENFISLNTGNGKLTHNTIQAISRDSFGYLWVGTNFGLNKLDGYQTLNYISDPENPNSISSSFIKALFVDSQNELWVGTIGGGLNKFDRKTNGFIHFLPSSSPKSISGLNISAITEDKVGHIWIGTIGNGVNRYDKKTGQFEKYDLEKMDPFNRINSNVEKLFCDVEGNIWVGLNQGEVFKIDTRSNYITYYGLKKYHSGFTEVGSIKGISQLKNGTLLFVSWSGNLFKLNTETDDHIKFLRNAGYFDNNNLTDITIDGEDNIWISTWENGLYMIDPVTYEKTAFNRNKYLLNSLGSNALNQLFIDKNNNLLIGSSDNGLSLLPLRKKMFKSLSFQNSVTSMPEEMNVYSILRDNNDNLWIGTRGQGLIRYNLNTKKYKIYQAKIYQGLESNSILTLKKNEEGKIWLGTDGNFISMFDPENEKFTQIENRFDDWSKAIFCLAENDQFLWGGTWGGGIKKIDKKTGLYTSINFDDKDQFRNSIFDLELQDSILWVANIGKGLIRYNINNGHQTIYSNSTKFPDFPKERIIDIFIENSNSFWISTDGAGLFHFNPSTEKIENINKKYPLSGNIVQSVVTDKDGNIWIASISGVSYLNLKKGKCYNFDKNDGLLNNQLNKSALFFDRIDNIIYVGGVEGVNYFDPSEIIVDSTNNKVIITELKILGKSVFNPNGRNLSIPLDMTDELHLYYSDKVVTIHFSSMEFNPSSKNKYLYQLEGFEKEWTETPFSKNYVQYTNLFPGKYTFRVKAFNNDGICTNKETSLRIIVHPAFWQTIFFKLIVITALFFIIFLYFKNRYKNLIAAKNELEDKVKERTSEIQMQKEQIEQQNHELEVANETKNKFFSIISHDLRNPVTTIDQLAQLILMQHKIASEDKMLSYFQLLKKSSKNTLELLDDLLIWARTQTNRIEIRKENIPVDELLISVYSLCKSIAEEKKIDLIFPFQTKLSVCVDRNSISTVLRNLITNAIKFSYPKGKVEIKIEEKEDDVIFKIIDSGIGIKEKEVMNLFKIEKFRSRQGTSGETGTGLGLILCYEFLALNNGKIWVESEFGKGTTILFSVNKSG
jgi:signal transduction histidine kinase/streptogramin lyase